MALVQIISTNSVIKKEAKTSLTPLKSISVFSSFNDAVRNISRQLVDLIVIDAKIEEFATNTWLKKILEHKELQQGESSLLVLADVQQDSWQNLLKSRGRKFVQDIFFYNSKSTTFPWEAFKFFLDKNYDFLKLKRQWQYSRLEKEIQQETLQKPRKLPTSFETNSLPWLLQGDSTESVKNRLTFTQILEGNPHVLLTCDNEQACDYLLQQILFFRRQKSKKNLRIYEIDFKKARFLFQESLLDPTNLIKGDPNEKFILYLRNIENTDFTTQETLLKILHEKSFQKNYAIDTIIFSSRIDSERLIAESYIRQDLLYALKLQIIDIASYKRRRSEHVKMLQNLQQALSAEKSKTFNCDEKVIQAIIEHPWKSPYGDIMLFVQQLFDFAEKNIEEHRKRIFIDQTLLLKFLIHSSAFFDNAQWQETRSNMGNFFIKVKDEQQMNLFELIDEQQAPLHEIERHYIEFVIRQANGNLTESSRILQVSRKTLYEKIKRYEIKTQKKIS